MFSVVKTISNKALKHSINVMQETQSAILSLNARDLHIYAFFCISYTKLLEFFLMVCSCFVCFFFPWVCPFLQFFFCQFLFWFSLHEINKCLVILTININIIPIGKFPTTVQKQLCM